MQNSKRLPRWERGVWVALWMLLAALLIGCDSQAQKPLRVGVAAWAGYEPLGLAQELGYFDKRPVRLTEFSSATQTLQAFRSDTIDAACITMDEAIVLAENTPNIRAVLVFDFSNGADVVLGQPHMNSIADLRNKRVGYEASAEGAYVLSRALEQGGLKPGDVTAVPVEFDEHESAFREGRVDAIVTMEPARSHLLQTGAKLLFDSSKIPGELVDVLVVRESYLKNRPDAVDSVLGGWFNSLNYLKDKPEDATRRLGVRLKLNPPEVMDVYTRVKLLDLPENRQMLTGSPPALLASTQRMADQMLDRKLISRPIRIDSLIDPGPVSRAKPD